MVIIFAYKGDRVIGFKVGLIEQNDSMDSWRGGVVQPTATRVAQQLIRLQHEWCLQQVRVITTIDKQRQQCHADLESTEGFIL